jgi:hypothetical protein
MPTAPWTCRLGFHDWHILYNDEGAPYNECVRCRKVKGKAAHSDSDNSTGGHGGHA